MSNRLTTTNILHMNIKQLNQAAKIVSVDPSLRNAIDPRTRRAVLIAAIRDSVL